MTRRFRPPLSLVAALAAAGSRLFAGEEPKTGGAAEPGIVIGYDAPVIKTGWLEMDEKGAPKPLFADVVISVQNRTGQSCTTSAELAGKDASSAEVSLSKTENTENGQTLHLRVAGIKKSTEASETLLRIEAKQGGVVKASKDLPVHIVVPGALKLEAETIYEGPAKPGLVNRALNMSTIPKAAIRAPEAKLAAMCLHDLTMKVVDQFGDPLPEFYDQAPVWAALGKSDYEPTHRALRKDSTFIDTLGLWQFVGEVKDMTKEPDYSTVQKFLAEPPPPCTKQQYAAYEPLLMQWSVGGHPIGTYERQVTLIDTGNDHKPNVKITLKPVETPALPEPNVRVKDETR